MVSVKFERSMNNASGSKSEYVLPNTAAIKTNEHKVDLQKAPRYQLLEMLDRQTKLASNKKALDKLPDRGAKIISRKVELEKELGRRENVGDLIQAFSSLRLQLPASIDNIEWHGNLDEETESMKEDEDVETNPFKILANHSGAGFHKKEIKVEEAEQPLITDKDLEDLYSVHLYSKLDKVQAMAKFLPHKTLNKSQPVVKSRDVTAASQPPPKFLDAKLVSLEDSIKLQQEHGKQLKEVQLHHALERLKERNVVTGDKLPVGDTFKHYRDIVGNEDKSDDEEEVIEVRDECEEEDTGGIVNFVLSGLDDVD